MPIFEYNCEDCKYNFNQLLISRDTRSLCQLSLSEFRTMLPAICLE